MESAPGDRRAALVHLGRVAWAVVGIVAVVVMVVWLLVQLRVVVSPLVIAVFPAAVLWPVAGWLRRLGLPAAVAALLTVAAAIGLLVGVGRLVVPLVAAEVPALVDAVAQGFEDLQRYLRGTLPGSQLDVFDEPLENLAERLGQGEVADQTLSAVRTVVETVTETLLMIVALFFYLKDGPRMVAAVEGFVSERLRPEVHEVAGRVWYTLGAYFRGQLLIALVDAVGIGLGLVLLGVPLAIPLALIVLVGGMFPIIGAFVSGLVAVSVALADQGLVTALLVLAVVIIVQQLEGNILEPAILSRAINLHPLVVLASVAAGAITVGILGAFLAVPIAASIARIVEHVRGRGDHAAADASQNRVSSSEATPRSSS